MPKDIDSKLEDILDVSSVIRKETKLVKIPTQEDQMVNDYKYGRETLYNLVERGQDAIDGILDLCKETEHPRAYEVAGQLIKTVGDTAEKLLDLQKKMKDLQNENEGVKTQHNHLYVGSTSELQKFLKKENKKD
tara:strand:+ start:379 stop:780 length:402 start_codon:yes stop_codon:yes gene_type:complete